MSRSEYQANEYLSHTPKSNEKNTWMQPAPKNARRKDTRAQSTLRSIFRFSR